jgi:cytidine deaminase
MVRPGDEALVAAAVAARARAHAPYSRYAVGAAVLCESGRVFQGCNVEISSYSLTCCAERVAVFKAVSEGETRILAVAVVTEDDPPASPCGACRQVLYDFGGAELRVVVGHPAGGVARSWTLGELLPAAFGPENLLGR